MARKIITKKEFDALIPKIILDVKAKGLPKLNEKETLELARLDLRTACRRLEDALKLLKTVEEIVEWEIPLAMLIKLQDFRNGAWKEIERAGVNLGAREI